LTQKSNKKSQADSKGKVIIAEHSFYESALEHPVIRSAQGRKGRCVLLVTQEGANFSLALIKGARGSRQAKKRRWKIHLNRRTVRNLACIDDVIGLFFLNQFDATE
jgi:hypothetical protein